MKLRAWLSQKNMTQTLFAEKVGAHPITVSKWVADVMMPRRGHLHRIFEITDGSVTANDFVGSPTSQESVA